MNRRGFLVGLPVVAAGAGSMPIAGLALPPAEPSRADLVRYYAYLWHELSALSRELGVPMHHFETAHDNGDMDAVDYLCTAPASSRAVAVLAAAGAGREALAVEGPAYV